MTEQTALITRFAPSPTGYLHVGGARTALLAYLLARQSGGRFILRIEDTDRARHEESAVAKIIDDLHWLGLDWDEGPQTGGPNGPYRQSQRREMYDAVVAQLLQAGKAYYAFETAEELAAMRDQAQRRKESFVYPRPERFPTQDQADAAAAAGKPVVVRFLVPGREVTIHDDAFGEVTIPADQQDDFVIRKADGWPTYHLANVVDDAKMGVTYITRGQEFLGQTWRHALLREALGIPQPRYCHLPLIMDMQGRKLSKRDGAVEVHAFRAAGYLPEALRSFIALLGWNPGTDQELFTLSELIEQFGTDRIGKSNAKFDRDKLLAFNTAAIAAADTDRLVGCFAEFLSLNDTPIPADDQALLRRLIEINSGIRTFQDIVDKTAVLFGPDDAYDYQDKAVRKVLAKNDGAGWDILAQLRVELETCDWTAEALEQVVKSTCESREVGMGKVAQPLRVAVTGTMVSPAIFDTLILLGQDKTLARIDRCLALRSQQDPDQ